MTAPGSGALDGRRVLVVEDDFLVAEMIREFLTDEGATVLGPIGWVDEALAFLESGAAAPDVALLDINLHGQTSYAIARVLSERAIRCVFLTGYSGSTVSAPFDGYPRCEKPVRASAIVAALTAATAEAAGR